jgi:hypothetical protein
MTLVFSSVTEEALFVSLFCQFKIFWSFIDANDTNFSLFNGAKSFYTSLSINYPHFKEPKSSSPLQKFPQLYHTWASSVQSIISHSIPLRSLLISYFERKFCKNYSSFPWALHVRQSYPSVFFTLIIFGKEYKLWLVLMIPSLHSFPTKTLYTFLISPNCVLFL